MTIAPIPPKLKPIREDKKEPHKGPSKLSTRFWWAAGVVAYGWIWVWFFVLGGFTDLTGNSGATRMVWLALNGAVLFLHALFALSFIIHSLNEWLDKQDEG